MIVRTGPSLFHVSVGTLFLFPHQRQAIEVILSEAGDWLRYTGNCWIVYGGGPIQEWAKKLRAVQGLNTASIFIVDIGNEYTGYLTPEAWEWLKKFQQV